jgi:hypothetical protein
MKAKGCMVDLEETIAKETNRYDNKDWVRPVKQDSTEADDDDDSNSDGDNSNGDDKDNNPQDDDAPKKRTYFSLAIRVILMPDIATKVFLNNGNL